MTSQDPCILYVDDERPNRIVFEATFNDKFRIRTVGSGQEALELLKTETVGVIVTDQRMTTMSGNELLLRVKEIYPDIVRVIVTAYSDLDPILRAVNDGLVARYLVKPWNRTELEQVLSWGLEAFKLGQNNSALQLRIMQTERLVTLGSIGAAVIHDLNQPLCYLSTNTDRLSQLAGSASALEQLVNQHGNNLTQEQRDNLRDLATELPEIVRDMESGCTVMRELTSSIRKLLRPSGENTGPSTVDPLPIIRYAISVCRGIASQARGTVLYDGPTSLPHVIAGTTELTQVLINLISNASQALTRRPQPGGRVVTQVLAQSDMVRFVISDDGPGMSPEVLQRVGTPFFSTRSEGTGLGVAQCRRLVEKYGGRFSIESTEGVGTTVTFTVPKAS